jgi:arylsulfatase A-like enzyme
MSKPGMAGALAAVVTVIALALIATGGGERISTSPTSPAAEHDPGAPNVVVVMTDDQALDTMRAMPHTRRLVGDKGVRFDNAVVSFPLCCPSRATFQTGQYAHNHRVLDNHPPRGGYDRLDTERTLPVWLSQAGYETGFVGKFLNGYGKGKAAREVPPGWSDWYGLPATAKQRPFEFELNENGELVRYERDDYKTEVLADKTTSFLRAHAGGERPFFLWVATDAPHKDAGVGRRAERNPEPAPRDRGRYEHKRAPNRAAVDEKDVSDKPDFVKGRKRLDEKQREEIRKVFVSQLESLVAIDRLVKGIVNELRHAGELDDTLIVFTSDNGFLRGQHRIESGKASLYEQAIRVPLLVRGPGFPEGVRDDRLVGNIDLAPTILELTGAPADLELDGRSLLPFERSRDHRGRTILLEVFERQTGRFVGVRTRRYAYADYDDGQRELYDLKRDPQQLDNVADARRYAGVREKLAKRVAELRNCAGTECR